MIATVLPTGLLVNGEWCRTNQVIQVVDKFTHEVVAEVARAGKDDVDEVVAAAAYAQRANPMPSHRRAAMLRRTAEIVAQRSDLFERVYIAETGFTKKDAAVELARAKDTILLSAEEATRLTGETVPVRRRLVARAGSRSL